jgi:hypothetical protein
MTLEKGANYKRAAIPEIDRACDEMHKVFVAVARMPTV